MAEMNRADARRADRGETSFVVRSTTKRSKRRVPASASLQIRRRGWRGLFRKQARVDSLCEFAMTTTMDWRPAMREELKLDLAIGNSGERFALEGLITRIEDAPERPGWWRVEIQLLRVPAPMKVCLRSV